MTNVSAVGAASGSRATGSTKKTTPVREAAYKVKQGDNLTQIAKKFGMTANEFKAWTGLTSDHLSIGQTINLPQSKVPESKGIMALANKYNMDFESFCKLNNIPKPYREYVAGKDEMFYVCQNYGKSATGPKKSDNTTPAQTDPPKAGDNNNTTTEKKEITLDNCKKFTLKQLRDDAIRSAKNSDDYRGAETKYINRPLPHVVNGKIEATCEVRTPTSTQGSLKGKVIILNPGHGGYSQQNGFFDSGAVSTRADANGDMVPVEEWKVAQSVTDHLATKLRAQGATVIIVAGRVKNPGGMCEQKYLEGLLAGTKGPEEARSIMRKTKHSDMMFLSIHFEGEKSNSGNKACSVRPYPGDNQDMTFAQNIQSKIKSGFSLMTPKIEAKDYYVTRKMGSDIPSVLLEVGNIYNETIHRMALSSHDLNKYADCLYDAIDVTFNPPDKKKK